jgi:hypothetical protein
MRIDACLMQSYWLAGVDGLIDGGGRLVLGNSLDSDEPIWAHVNPACMPAWLHGGFCWVKAALA